MAYSDPCSHLEDCIAQFANRGAIREVIAEVTPVGGTADVRHGSLKAVSSTWRAPRSESCLRSLASLSGLSFLGLPQKGMSFHQAVYCSRSPVPFITGVFL